MSPAGGTEPDTHCKSAALSIFKKSCLALSKMSGSSLGTSRQRWGWGEGQPGRGEGERGAGERKYPVNTENNKKHTETGKNKLKRGHQAQHPRERGHRAGTEDRQPPRGNLGWVVVACPHEGTPSHEGGWGGGTTHNPPSLLDVLADLAFQALPPLLQLLDGALLRELVGRRPHLALGQ